MFPIRTEFSLFIFSKLTNGYIFLFIDKRSYSKSCTYTFSQSSDFIMGMTVAL